MDMRFIHLGLHPRVSKLHILSLLQNNLHKLRLVLYLPLLVEEYIPEDDEHWGLLRTLLQIVRIVFAPTISKKQIPYL